MRMALASASTSYSLSMDAEIPLEANGPQTLAVFFEAMSTRRKGIPPK